MRSQTSARAPASSTMRAVLFRKTGSVDGLVLADVPTPVPGEHEVLVRIHTTTVTAGDVVLRKMPFLLARLLRQRRKAMLGHEFAGTIEAVGPAVTRFALGDRVFGTTTGLAVGSYAEAICVPADGILATLPDGVGFEEAAAVPVGGMVALQLLRRGGVASGDHVLVIGATGSVGTYAVQLAADAGARVTGVAGPNGGDLVRSLGAERVLDHTRDDYGGLEARFDVIVDAVGKGSSGRNKRVLAEGGRVVTVRSSIKERLEGLETLRDLLAAGRIRAVIDRRYPLEEIREAHLYVETGRKLGNVLVVVRPDPSGPPDA